MPGRRKEWKEAVCGQKHGSVHDRSFGGGQVKGCRVQGLDTPLACDGCLMKAKQVS